MKRNIPCLTTLLCSATAGLFAICTAHAGYIVTLTQQGPNVVANGSGAIDLTGLTFDGTKSAAGEGIFPSRALIGTGAAGSVDGYVGIIGPTNFGSGGVTFASSGSGDWVGVAGTAIGNFPDGIAVLHGYVSGSRLLDSAIYDNATFASLGVTPGTYEWTWGTGANQNFTLQIESARVPETGSTLAMLAMALAAVFGASRLRSAKLA